MSSRRRLTYVLVAMLPVLLVAGVWWGGHPEDLPAFARSSLVAHADTRVVDEAIERISSDYYRPVANAARSRTRRSRARWRACTTGSRTI